MHASGWWSTKAWMLGQISHILPTCHICMLVSTSHKINMRIFQLQASERPQQKSITDEDMNFYVIGKVHNF